MGRECNDIEEFGPIRVAKVKIHTIDDVLGSTYQVSRVRYFSVIYCSDQVNQIKRNYRLFVELGLGRATRLRSIA